MNVLSTFVVVALTTILVAVLFFAGDVSALVPRGKALTSDYTYEKYIKDFFKTERTKEEHEMRRNLFNVELALVLEHNNIKPPMSYLKGVNKFSDWTREEKMSTLNNNYLPVKQTTEREGKIKPSRIHVASARAAAGTLPHTVDWTTVLPRVVTSIKDQGSCGSCWAHAATEAAESRWAIATGELFVLSQEQVTACTPNPDDCGGSGGCNGATHELAFDYMSKHPLTQEWQMPYTSYTGTTGACKEPEAKYSYAHFDGYMKVTENDAAAVMDALVDGPLAVVVDAAEWFNYDSGIYTGCNYANNISLDHGVNLVSYSYDEVLQMNYWRIRNSWSPNFGENGYIRLFRASSPAKEACGLNVNITNGIACKGTKVKYNHVCGTCGLLFDATAPIAKITP